MAPEKTTGLFLWNRPVGSSDKWSGWRDSNSLSLAHHLGYSLFFCIQGNPSQIEELRQINDLAIFHLYRSPSKYTESQFQIANKLPRRNQEAPEGHIWRASSRARSKA
jgi:hypothetical protein